MQSSVDYSDRGRVQIFSSFNALSYEEIAKQLPRRAVEARAGRCGSSMHARRLVIFRRFDAALVRVTQPLKLETLR